MLPEQIGERYQVLAQLGRGGSADVYHVRDISSTRELALKRLRRDLPAARVLELTRHLEREFYALAQLRHPRVIEVHDYGVSEGLPYYTMELLDGGDVRTAAPLPFRRACELVYDVASSLALLHSRRYVHRDVTPSNIRCTRDGRAKLIDFGAMAQMGSGASVIGTPAFVAPEVQQRGVMDAGTDLFSLGATLYFLITGRPPFAATDLAGMPAAWAVPPEPPSKLAPDVPAALDSLVLALLSIDPSHRPRTAFEVMQRLAAIAELRVSESAHVTAGYLSAPQVFGRDAALRGIRTRIGQTLGGSGAALWLEGEAGVGRSRLLELCTLEAKTAGACVVRLDASGGGAPFALAGRLAQALLAALPEIARRALPESPALTALVSGADISAERAALPEALTRWLLAISAVKAVVLAIDDVQRVDEPTLAWLAALAPLVPRAKLLLIATADSESVKGAGGALAVLERNSGKLPVQPLTRAESDAVFASIFGVVPNLALVSERIFALAAGNPQRSLALAQYLVDSGHARYAAGSWSLPDELPPESLAVQMESLLAARIARLGSLARTLAETQALSLAAALRREDYRVLALSADPRSLDDALSELIAHEIVRSDGQHYALAHRAYASLLRAQINAVVLAQRHEALARLAEQQQRHPYVVAYHRLHAGQQTSALELLLATPVLELARIHDLDPTATSGMLERALSVIDTLDRPRRERFELIVRLMMVSLLGDVAPYYRVAPQMRAQLEVDSGLRDYWAHREIAEDGARLTTAITETMARRDATPEHDRVYSLEEAWRSLGYYIVMSIAISRRTHDAELLHSLPHLLEPFAALAPVLEAIRQNAEATCDSAFRARPERAVERWVRVHEFLEANASTLRLDDLRAAITYGIGEQLAGLGQSAAAMQWIERLDREPLQRVNAMRVRAVVCLQHGDWAGAVRAREQAELMALQASGAQLFGPPLRTELNAYWLARDLAGLKQTVESAGRLVASAPALLWVQRLAQGCFDAVRGDAASALATFDACVTECEPDASEPARRRDVWVFASAAAISTLLELGRTAEARARAERVLAHCRVLEIFAVAQPIECELAIAEARSDEGPRAIARVERVIADQLQRGVSGLSLAATYEARARVAMSLRQEADVMRYAALAAREYRHGAGSSVASRYGRLLQEARSAGVQLPPEIGALAQALAPPQRDAETAAIARTLDDTSSAELSQRVLGLLCERAQAKAGHLYAARGPGSDLRLLASSGGSPPSAALARFSAAFWQQQLDDAEMSAVLTELPWSHDTYWPGNWNEPQGQCYEAIVLYDPRALPAHVGLALLDVGPHPRKQNNWPTALLATLAAGLSRARAESK